MTLPDVGVLAGLALLDSTSTGTLTIPVVMLLSRECASAASWAT